MTPRSRVLATAASLAAALIGASRLTPAAVTDPVVAALVTLGAVVALALAPRRGPPPPSPGIAEPGPSGRAAVLAALAVRVPWLLAPAVFSDDVYRYVWEGLVWRGGYNPFALAPADPALAGLHPEGSAALAIWARVNHPELSSIYPPFAQLLFVAVAPAGVLGWKLLATAADLGTVHRLAQGGGVNAASATSVPGDRVGQRAAWLWALLPLTAMESAGSGHLEAVGVYLLVRALTSTGPAAGVWAWLGAMTKLLPAAALLPRLRSARAWAIAGLASLVAFGPILAAGPHLAAGFDAYRARWSFNGSAYPLLAELVGPDPARLGLQAAGAAIVAAAIWRWRDEPADRVVARLALLVTSTFVLLSPTVHPWYVLWPLAVALAVEPEGPDLTALWTLAAVLVPLAYRVLGTLHDGSWTETASTRWAIWLPVWALGLALLGKRPAGIPSTAGDQPAGPGTPR